MKNLLWLSDRSDKLVKSYWLLGLFQICHSMEESATKLYQEFAPMSEALHKIIPWIPQFEISADEFAILNYLIIGLILGTVPAVEKAQKLGFIFLWVWVVIELLNGAFHLGTWVFLRAYFPGGISGPALFVLSLFLLQQLQMISDRTPQTIQ